jgi:hypothetical protein
MIDVLFVIAQHSLLLDIAGPAEAFRLVNLRRTLRRAAPHFRLRFVGPEPVASRSVGLVLAELEPLPKQLQYPSWVVVVGQPSVQAAKVTPSITVTATWLNRVLQKPIGQAACPHRLVTICSGTPVGCARGLAEQPPLHHAP